VLERFKAGEPALVPSFWSIAEQVNGPVRKLCRDPGLTPYDALYVELAMRANCPLVTQDEAQRIAASALHIECLGSWSVPSGPAMLVGGHHFAPIFLMQVIDAKRSIIMLFGWIVGLSL
jgi:hypothetical protein